MAKTQPSGAQILDNSIANADLAQMANNTIKGNVAGSTANAADLTVLEVQTMLGLTGGSVTGSGANTRVAYWTSASNISGDSGMTYNAATDTLTIAGELFVTSNITSNNTVTANTSVAGNVALIGAISTDNTNASSGAVVQILVGGATAGDPNVQLVVTGITTWTVGIDNSDSDKLKIGPNSVVGTSTSMTITTTGLVGIGVSPTYAIDVSNAASIVGRFASSATHAQIRLDAPTTFNTNISFAVNAVPKFYAGYDATLDTWRVLNSDANGNDILLSITQAGVVSAPNYISLTAQNRFDAFSTSEFGQPNMAIRLQRATTEVNGIGWDGGIAVGPGIYVKPTDDSLYIGTWNGGGSTPWSDIIQFATTKVTVPVAVTLENTLNVGSGTAPNAAGSVVITQTAVASTATSVLNMTYGSHTALTASTEWIPYKIGTATSTWAAGTLTTQRYVNITTPTIAFATTSTATTAITLHISGAPTAGTNATITNPIGIQVSSSSMSYTSATAVAIRALDIRADTITLTGTTAMTATPGLAGIRINQLTLTNGSAVTVTNAASLYIADAPVGAGLGPVTITNKYAIWVDAGYVQFDGGLNIGVTGDPGAGNVNIGGTLQITGSLTTLSTNLFGLATANTTTVANLNTLSVQSTGSVGDGFGMDIDYQLETTTTVNIVAAKDAILWATAANGTRKARRIFTIYDTASREGMRIEASGTAPMIGFLGAAAVIRQTVAVAAVAGGTGTAAGGYDTAPHRDAMITLINNMRTAGINLGLWA